MLTEYDNCCTRDYKADYEAERKRNEALEANCKRYSKDYEDELDKRLELTKENQKLKTIITKLLEEKYCVEGD